MKIKFYLLLFLIIITQAFGQTNHKPAKASILPRANITKLFNDSIKKKFSIDYNLFKAYTYTDHTGKYFIVLTEKMDGIANTKDTLHLKIKAFAFKSVANKLEKQWEVYDFTIAQADDSSGENSIWFWTKYCEFKDIDGDGVIDPIVVYGTSGINGTDDGRIKILVFYKGQKIALRHQNGVLDSERWTQVDQGFYSLALSIQSRVKELMQKMKDDNNAIFPYGWQDAMKKHKLQFDESH